MHEHDLRCNIVFAKKNYFFVVKKTNKKIWTFLASLKKLDKVVKLVGGGSVINGAYPV